MMQSKVIEPGCNEKVGNPTVKTGSAFEVAIHRYQRLFMDGPPRSERMFGVERCVLQ